MSHKTIDKISALVILGGGESQIPSITTGALLGYYTIVIDPNNKCPGAHLADEFLAIDMSDREQVLNQLSNNKMRISGVVTNAADFPIPLLAYIVKTFKLKGPTVEAALCNTNKIEMRKALCDANINCPVWEVARNCNEALDKCNVMKMKFNIKKVVFKPMNSSGGRGILAVNIDENNIDLYCDKIIKAYNYSVKYNRNQSVEVLIEEMVEGDEFSVESLTADESDSVIVAITNKYNTGSPYFVETSHSQPCFLSQELQELIKSTVLSVLTALKVTYAPGHTELKINEVDGKKRVVIIESACRLGGGNISLLTKKSTSIDMVEASIQLATGVLTSVQSIREKLESIKLKQLPASAVQMLYLNDLKLSDENRMPIIKSVKGVSDAYASDGVFHCLIVGRPGDRVYSLKDDSCRFGAICCEGLTISVALERAKKAADMIKFQISTCNSETSSNTDIEVADLDLSIPIFDSLTHSSFTGYYMGTKLLNSFSALNDSMTKYNIIGTCVVSISSNSDFYSHETFITYCNNNNELHQRPLHFPVAILSHDEIYNDITTHLKYLRSIGYKIIKIHPRFVGITDWSILTKVFESAAENDLFVFLCTWSASNVRLMPIRDPYYDIVNAIRQSPLVKVVLLHGGGSDLMKYADLVRSNENLLLDISFTMNRYAKSSIETDIIYLCNNLDQRMCIGSDYPEGSQFELRKRFLELTTNLSNQKTRNIAYRSLMTFLKLNDSSIFNIIESECNKKLLLQETSKGNLELTEKAKLDIISRYQTRLSEHGHGFKALGWLKGGHDTRLSKLCSQYDFVGKSILDLGCGYGDLLDYLPTDFTSYLGIDVVPEFITEAARKYLEKSKNNQNDHNVEFQVAEFLSFELMDRHFDYVIASGIFNRKLITDQDNYVYIETVLKKINEVSNDGFAIDFLSTEGVDFVTPEAHHSNPEIIKQMVRNVTKFSNINIERNYFGYEFAVYASKSQTLPWLKKGLLIAPDPNIYWMSYYAGASFIQFKESNNFEIYITGRDTKNVSRIGKAYGVLENDSLLIKYIEPTPIFIEGEEGCFDGHGVSYPWIITVGLELFMYYVGWVSGGATKFTNFLGLAISKDGGNSFERYSKDPIIGKDVEPFGTGSCSVIYNSNTKIFEMLYTSFYSPLTSKRFDREKDASYDIKIAYSTNGINWTNNKSNNNKSNNDDKYRVAIPLLVNETIVGKPSIYEKGNGEYEVYFSARGDFYKIYVSVGEDLSNLIRLKSIELDVSSKDTSEWDSEMVEYAHVIRCGDLKIMIYNGNSFGKSGLGYAIIKNA